MSARKNSDILKGSQLLVFMDGSPIGFATSHSINLNTQTTEISTKDHGNYPSVIPQTVSWEVTAENLYSTAGKNLYMTAVANMSTVHLIFTEAGNWESDEHGVLTSEEQGATTNAKEWQVGSSTQKIAEGDAIITSFSINAPAGDNATMSVTFTGKGALTTTFS